MVTNEKFLRDAPHTALRNVLWRRGERGVKILFWLGPPAVGGGQNEIFPSAGLPPERPRELLATVNIPSCYHGKTNGIF